MDSERPIEKVLRAQAKKRREEPGAGFELHPVDRKVLQDEVARTFGRNRRARSLPQVLGLLLPRLVWGTAILAVLGVAVFIFLPSSQPSREKDAFLAQNLAEPPGSPARDLPEARKSSLSEQPATPLGSPGSVDTADRALLTARRARADSPQSLTLKDEAASSRASGLPAGIAQLEPAPTLATGEAGKPTSPVQRYGLMTNSSTVPVPTEPPPVTPTVATAEFYNQTPNTAKLALSASPSFGGTKPAPATAIATDGFANNGTLNKDAFPTVSQRFAQVQLKTKAKASALAGAPPSTPVLVDFQLEQSGDELRIVDTDGSVYTGRLQAPEAQQAANQSRQTSANVNRVLTAERSFARTESQAPSVQNYSFQVTGTNVSVKQRIVFSGNLASPTNLTLGNVTNNLLNNSSILNQAPAAAAFQNSNALLNCRISGRAQIGNRKEVQIEAVPAP